MSRKDKLQERALQYGRRQSSMLVSQYRTADGFEAGYLAAMRDVRKIRKSSRTFTRLATQLWCWDNWLRPLR